MSKKSAVKANSEMSAAPPPSPTVSLDFCLVGAPKCGTSAMAAYLASHNDVAFSLVKEPFYYATDLAGLRSDYGVANAQSYDRLFIPGKSRLAEGSTLYAYSSVAIQHLLSDHPECKLIMMVRRPDDMFRSYYQQMRLHGYEDAETPEEAWSLQDHRLQTGQYPRGCFEPKLIRYREVISTGIQVQRIAEQVAADKLLVILYEDFAEDPTTVYRSTLDFLSLAREEKSTFERVNIGATVKWRFLHRMLLTPTSQSLRRSLKRTLPKPLTKAIAAMQRSLVSKPIAPVALSESAAKEIREGQREDIAILENHLGRSLSNWLVSRPSHPNGKA